MSLAKNIALCDLRPVSSRYGAISGKSERGEVMDWLTRLDVRPPNRISSWPRCPAAISRRS